MAIRSFDRSGSQRKTPAGPAEAPAAAPAVPAQPEEPPMVIGDGCVAEGTLSLKKSVRVDGEFRGEIRCEETIVVSESAGVEANLHAKNIVVIGAVVGDVVASRELTLEKTAKVTGNIEAAALHIEKGAVFNGQAKMVHPLRKSRDLVAPRERARRSAPRPPTPYPGVGHLG